ncbi:MAG: hypothetical protein NXI16_08175 [Alphaproteobacteria bacterium]|nr:hypothetical protein [Alphaproteobacteria bacterium]
MGGKLKNAIVAAAAALVLASCASQSSEITASYVSPLKYQDYNCRTLSNEYARVLSKSSVVSQEQDQTATNDAVAMGVGLILFWPALFLIDTDDQSEQVAMLKGELDAIEKTAITKDCDGLQSSIIEDRIRVQEEMKKRAAQNNVFPE